MDAVIRKQSEKIDKDNFNDNGATLNCGNYDYRKWEWGYLRVSTAVPKANV